MQAFADALRHSALFLRQIAALIALFLAIRLLWMSGQAGLRHASRAFEAQGSSVETSAFPPLDPPPEHTNHRPDLEELKKLAGSERDTDPAAEDALGPRQRRILVDLGPERSEVFLRGQRVGRTPYGGQVACKLDEILKVQVLPDKGLPFERTVVCRGDTLVVQR